MAEYRKAISGSTGDGDVSVTVEPLAGDVDSKVLAWVSTGSVALDRMMAGKGIPCGRVTEVFGPNYIGKSTLLNQLFSSVQRACGFGILVDAENAWVEDYSRGLAVDTAALQVLQFKSGELSVEHVVNKVFASIDWWRTEFPERPVVIGWDAFGSTATNDELSKRIGEATMASAAKAMRASCRQVAGRIGGSRVALVVLNHTYEAIGKHTMGAGTKRETYGGEALRLATSMRLELYNAGPVKRGSGVVVGREIGAKLIKNRFGPPDECRIAILHGLGIDNTWTLFHSLQEAKMIVTSGNWSQLTAADGEQLKFQGWTGLRRLVGERPELFGQLVAAYQAAFPVAKGTLE